MGWKKFPQNWFEGKIFFQYSEPYKNYGGHESCFKKASFGASHMTQYSFSHNLTKT